MKTSDFSFDQVSENVKNFEKYEDVSLLDMLTVQIGGFCFLMPIFLLAKWLGVELTFGYLATILPVWLLVVIKLASCCISIIVALIVFKYGKQIMIILLNKLNNN
ncbi:MAG: hypothetical protein NTY12_05030 [Candidatus Falkowbacteria bacterium]|nr:hypothetical protein [Candidatus Falkowbacteria bacterium]